MIKKKKKSKRKKSKDSDWEITGYYIADGKTQVMRRHKKSGRETKSYRM